jgi:hypothetical protein
MMLSKPKGNFILSEHPAYISVFQGNRPKKFPAKNFTTKGYIMNVERIKLTVEDLKKIKDIINELGIEEFTLKQEGVCGIGTILTLECGTFVADYPSKIVVKVNGVEAW